MFFVEPASLALSTKNSPTLSRVISPLALSFFFFSGGGFVVLIFLVLFLGVFFKGFFCCSFFIPLSFYFFCWALFFLLGLIFFVGFSCRFSLFFYVLVGFVWGVLRFLLLRVSFLAFPGQKDFLSTIPSAPSFAFFSASPGDSLLVRQVFGVFHTLSVFGFGGSPSLEGCFFFGQSQAPSPSPYLSWVGGQAGQLLGLPSSFALGFEGLLVNAQLAAQVVGASS